MIIRKCNYTYGNFMVMSKFPVCLLTGSQKQYVFFVIWDRIRWNSQAVFKFKHDELYGSSLHFKVSHTRYTTSYYNNYYYTNHFPYHRFSCGPFVWKRAGVPIENPPVQPCDHMTTSDPNFDLSIRGETSALWRNMKVINGVSTTMSQHPLKHHGHSRGSFHKNSLVTIL